MVKVVVKNLRPKRGKKAGRRAVKERRVAGPDGSSIKIISLETDSESFGDDLLYAFRNNVAMARRSNTDRLGVADFVPEIVAPAKRGMRSTGHLRKPTVP